MLNIFYLSFSCQNLAIRREISPFFNVEQPTSFPFFSPILAFFHRLQELTGLSGAVFAPLFKTAAIGLLAQMAATICRDSGQQALAQAVEICCGFISFYLALPLLEMVLSLLQTMIGG